MSNKRCLFHGLSPHRGCLPFKTRSGLTLAELYKLLWNAMCCQRYVARTLSFFAKNENVHLLAHMKHSKMFSRVVRRERICKSLLEKRDVKRWSVFLRHFDSSSENYRSLIFSYSCVIGVAVRGERALRVSSYTWLLFIANCNYIKARYASNGSTVNN